tara:strand:- start:11072 stop:11197 length:126 start_codon:yes stop_codon:yes gene_type:complete
MLKDIAMEKRKLVKECLIIQNMELKLVQNTIKKEVEVKDEN